MLEGKGGLYLQCYVLEVFSVSENVNCRKLCARCQIFEKMADDIGRDGKTKNFEYMYFEF